MKKSLTAIKTRMAEIFSAFLNLHPFHYICAGITAIFLGCGFLFPNALPRAAESVKDLFDALVYYVAFLVAPDNRMKPASVTQLQSWQWVESPWEPLTLFPYTWEEFKVLWGEYWAAFVSEQNFAAYWVSFGDTALLTSRILLVAMPLVLVLILKLRSYTNQPVSLRKGKSKHLVRFESFTQRIIYPCTVFLKDLVGFIVYTPKYWQLWLFLWMLYFNVIPIIISAIAFYLYFICSFDVVNLYTQFLKLLNDLTPMIRFLPGVVWLLLGVYVYNYICRSLAFQRLYAYERANRSFLNKRGVVTTGYGPMGVGKTQFITSLSLSAEIQQWDDAFEILLECDLRFPNFPWQNLRDYLNRVIDKRELPDLDAVRARMMTYKRGFDYVLERGFLPSEWQEYRKGKNIPDYTFGYDYEHYRISYNDNLKDEHLFDCIADYAAAYLVFTVRTSLIFANYSIRVDSILEDLGNMPLRNSDFFSRNVGSRDAFSRQCHIINYDMLRLGKRMQKEFKLSFGVYVITEIDKERKNALELRETKKNVEEVNQQNDLFNACLMMCRHAAVIRNRVFIRIIADLQRPEAWGAGGRELGEVIYISEKGPEAPCLPILSPYWLCQGLFLWMKSKWKDFHSRYIHRRRDGTLFEYAVTNIVSAINHHYDKLDGQFGVFTLNLEIQSGRLDGEAKKDKWRIIKIKDRSERYKTDCLQSVFKTYEPNTMHIDDFIAYAGKVGTVQENGLQNSYFQNDVHRMHEQSA